MSKFPFQAVVFDVDGTLFDTERLSRGNWLAVGRELGWPQVGEAYLDFVGQNRADIREKMRSRWGGGFPMEEFLETCSRRSLEQIEREGVPLKPGAREILAALSQRGVPLALATSTSGQRTARRLELTGLGPCFQSVTTGDQVSQGKPHPEIYLLACARMGTDPAHTLAVEDSANGIRSAHGAGMPVAMVPDLIPPTPELEAMLWGQFASLIELRDFLCGTL